MTHPTNYNDWEEVIGTASQRALLCTNNPVLEATIYDLMATANFEILFGCQQERMLKKSTPFASRKKGVFGRAKAAFEVTEAQGRGAAHGHAVVFTEIDPDCVQAHVHNQQFREKYIQFVDRCYSSGIHELVAEEDSARKANNKFRKRHNLRPHPVPWPSVSEPPQCISQLSVDSSRCAMKFQFHEHTVTCIKQGLDVCRLAMTRPVMKTTMFTQLLAAKSAIRKDVKYEARPLPTIEPPSPSSDANELFARPDDRIIAVDLATPCCKGEISPYNLTRLSCIRGNINDQFLGARSQAIAAFFYITSYAMKGIFVIANTLALIFAARKAAIQFPSSTGKQAYNKTSNIKICVPALNNYR